jgi:hypothetical protein
MERLLTRSSLDSIHLIRRVGYSQGMANKSLNPIFAESYAEGKEFVEELEVKDDSR